MKAPRWFAALGLLLATAMPAVAQCPLSIAAASNYAAGNSPRSVAVGDFNADGQPDLAVANNNSNNVSILLGNANGTFQAAVNYAVGNTPQSVAVGDFNGDGRPDLAVANSNSGTVSILLGNGNGAFQAAVNYAAGSGPWSVAVGDFNADGRPDLAVVNGNNVSILLGNGNGTFQAAANYAVGSGPVSVAVGDFNADGRPDLAVANAYTPNAGTISILLGNGNGTFQAAANYAVGSGPVSVAVGDFNADGRPDLAVANFNGANVSILLGNGNGAFQAAVNYGVGSQPYSVAVGDFNADGRPDLAVANANNFNVSILLGNANGTFQAAVNYNAGTGPISVAVGDFNADGRPDLAVANLNSGNVSILMGNANGTFQVAINYPVGNNPRAVAVGDFNADGRPDLAVANFSSGNVSVLLNTNLALLPPAIVQQPASQIVQAGQNAAIAITANGFGGTLTYQWRKNGVPIVNGGTIAGATSPTLTFTPALGGDTASYVVVVSTVACNGTQVITSAAVILGVTDPCLAKQPSITQQPTGTMVESGSAAVFTVAAISPAGGGMLMYQWRMNGVNLSDGGAVSGALTATLTIAAATFADNAATFDCIVSNACGSTRSAPAGLGVTQDCPADFNADGGVDGSDVDAFFDRWVTGC